MAFKIDFDKMTAEMRAERNGTTLEHELKAIKHEKEIRAQHHGYLPKEGVPFIILAGIQQKNSVQTDVHLVFEIQESPNPYRPEYSQVLKVVQGGMTGHEAYRLEPEFIERLSERQDSPFYLCAGGMGWPELFLPADVTKKLAAWVNGQVTLQPA